MAAALPRNIQLKLEQTLAQWRHWRCQPALDTAPELVAVLGRGVSNFSVLVGDTPAFVVRIDGISPARHGLNRQAEWRTLQMACTAGLAPQPRYFNPDLASLVCDYLVPDVTQPLRLEDVAGLLRDIHQLPPRHTRLDLAERIIRYEKQLEHKGRALPPAMLRGRAQVLGMLDELKRSGAPLVLCHNDLLRGNRIYSQGRLWAIDWEYSAMASPWYDMAVVVSGDELTEAQAGILLNAYLGRPARPAEWADLHRHSCIYRYLELLWYLAPERPVLAQPLLQARLASLEQALNPGNC